MSQIVLDKIEELLFHIENVQTNTLRLGQRLIEKGEVNLGRQLIANGQIHDNSKFHGIEFESLIADEPDPIKLKLAVYQHNHTNKHHPEAWGTIQDMCRLYVAEMVCDWKARSSEFGSSLHDWVNGDAMKRFGYTKDDEVFVQINYFVELLCEKPFKKI